MQPVEIDEQTAALLARRWWVPLVAGGLSALIGLVILFRPIAGVFGLALLIATGLIVSGITELASIPQWQTKWVPIVFGGLSLAAGVATVVWPDITLWALAVLIGVSLVVRGAVRVVGSLVVRPPWWGLLLAIGVVEVVLGIAALSWPEATIVVLALVMGINLIIGGAMQIALALSLKGLGGGDGPPPALA